MTTSNPPSGTLPDCPVCGLEIEDDDASFACVSLFNPKGDGVSFAKSEWAYVHRWCADNEAEDEP